MVFGNIPGNVRKWSIALWPYHCLIVRNEANPPSAIVIILREMDNVRRYALFPRLCLPVVSDVAVCLYDTPNVGYFWSHFSLAVIIPGTRGTLTAFENGFNTSIPGSSTQRVLFVDALVILLAKAYRGLVGHQIAVDKFK